jgi:hypothetical protein
MLPGAEQLPHTRSQPFPRGNTVVLRSVRDLPDRGPTVLFAVAGTVVVDTADCVAVATTPGSTVWTRAGRGEGPNHRTVSIDTWGGAHHMGAWSGDTVVRVHRWGEPWSVWRWHTGLAWTDRWYGNLERPWRRTPSGFDTQDWALDIVAQGAPGTTGWMPAYKDDDELQWMIERGTVTDLEGGFVRATGAALMERFVHAASPLDADWEQWLPDDLTTPVRTSPDSPAETA